MRVSARTSSQPVNSLAVLSRATSGHPLGQARVVAHGAAAGPRAHALLLHQPLEARVVHLQAGLVGRLEGQVEGEAEGVVQAEGVLAGHGAALAGAVDDLATAGGAPG